MRSLPRMVPGVCEMEWKQPGQFDLRMAHLQTPDSIVCLLSDTDGLQKGSTVIAHLRFRGTYITNVGLCALRDLGDEFSVRRVDHTGE